MSSAGSSSASFSCRNTPRRSLHCLPADRARFGSRLRTVTATLFLLTRAAAEGVRVYAVSIVVSIALGTGEVSSIAIITLLTLIYTFEGGLRGDLDRRGTDVHLY